MTAIRDFIKVDQHKINYTLPDDFNYNEVEIIIMPKTDDSTLDENNDVKSFSNHSASTINEWIDDREDSVWK